MRLLSAVSAAAILYGVQCAVAQDLPDVAQGLQPYVAYHGGELDQVNTYNGGLTIRIPLVSYPQKGSLSLSYSVLFNSSGFEDVAFCDAAAGLGPLDEIPDNNDCTNNVKLIPTGIQSSSSLPLGPRLVADQTLVAGGVSAARYDINPTQPPYYGLFYVLTSDNAEHPLGLATDGSYRSLDESGFAFAPSSSPAYGTNLGTLEGGTYSGDTTIVMSAATGTITDSRGITYTASAITDRDGNTISIPNSFPSSGAFSAGLPATDSTGRLLPALSTPSNGTSGCPALAQAQSQPLTGAASWTPPGTGNGYLFCFASVNLNSAPQFKQHGVTQYKRTVSMLQAIVLPNNTYWGFIYDSDTGDGKTGSGQLMTLIYPTGGSVSYTYASFGGACDDKRISGLVSGSIFTFPQAVLTRTMTDAQGWSGTWTYQYPPTISGAMTGSILSPANDLTVTKFAGDGSGTGCGFVSGGETVYQGDPANPAAATPLKDTTITYLVGGPGGTPPYVAALREDQTTTVLSGTATSSVQKGYASGTSLNLLNCAYPGQSCVSLGVSGPALIGGPNALTYTDYSGTMLKKESTTYQWENAPAYFTANLLDIPYTVQTLDGSGTPYAKTTYQYDESTYYPPGVVAGHPTTVTQSLLTNTTASPVTHTGWNASGMKTYFMDADLNANPSQPKNTYGHTIDYQYGSTSCNGSEVTDTYDAVNDHVSGAYDCSSGRLTSYTDANGATTQVSYDGLGRITLVTYPAIATYGNPTTTFCYESCVANQVQRTIAGSPDPPEITTIVFDGFGREIHRYTAASPQQTTVDTAYDPDGRIYSVSNPYYSSSDSTYGLTKYTYDGLNRKTLQTQQDNTSTLQWSFSGNQVTATDENSHARQLTSDSLGRLTEVMEPDPTSGTLDLKTLYYYDPLSNLTAVNQQGNSAAGDTPRNRNFSYDSLSRLVTSYNPEAGWTCYGTTGGAAPTSGNCTSAYDANGNLLSKTVQYLPSPAPPVITTFSYDGVNRLVGKSYQNDPGTPLSCFQYGLTSTAVAGANQIGRIMNAWTQRAAQGSCANSTGYLTLKAFTYDAMGRVASEQQCTPSKCTAAAGPTVSYTYDLAGNRTGITNSVGAQTSSLGLTYGFDSVARLSSLTSNWVAYPGNVFTIGTWNGYTAAGQLQNWMQGPSLTLTQGYTNRLWVNSIAATGQTP